MNLEGPAGPPYSLYEGIKYSEYWNGPRNQEVDELEHAIVRELLPNAGRRILDVGCGYGRLADCYVGHFQQVIMVDGSMSLLRQAVEKTAGQATYIAADVMHLPFQAAAFDAVLMIRVFQHIQDSRACFSELHRLLCSDGQLVFSYWNKHNVRAVLQWLTGASRENPFSSKPAGTGSALLRHQPKAVHRMLCESGFSGIQYRSVLDCLTGKTALIGRGTALNNSLAPFFGRTRVATWILCGAIVRGNTDLLNARGICDLLQCPVCGGNVSDDRQGYLCLVCKTCYPYEDGIIDMRV